MPYFTPVRLPFYGGGFGFDGSTNVRIGATQTLLIMARLAGELHVAVACLPIFFVGYSIARWEGALFLGYYVAYTLYLILAATEHDALPEFSTAMMYFVVPLTIVTLAIVLVREYSAKHRGRAV